MNNKFLKLGYFQWQPLLKLCRINGFCRLSETPLNQFEPIKDEGWLKDKFSIMCISRTRDLKVTLRYGLQKAKCLGGIVRV